VFAVSGDDLNITLKAQCTLNENVELENYIDSIDASTLNNFKNIYPEIADSIFVDEYYIDNLYINNCEIDILNDIPYIKIIDGGYMHNIVCSASSHFSSAERQYRYPLELGSTRPPQAQWTVTGAGACVVSSSGNGPKISSATVGRVVDYGVIDANNMGAAMAPAAADTIITHFKETNTNPSDYDLIVTGDLGTLGSRALKDLTWEKGFDIENQHVDCGELVYCISEEEYQGGSGAGCSALVFSSYLYKKIQNKEINKILFMSTGALLSSLSSQQGESIPGIAHAVVVES
jgi:stage V sporulation protein AD